MSGFIVHPSGQAAWAKPSHFTGESDNFRISELITISANKAIFRNSTIQESIKLSLHESRNELSNFALLFKKKRPIGFNELINQASLGAVPQIREVMG
jgi:hypothetical protein